MEMIREKNLGENFELMDCKSVFIRSIINISVFFL